MRIGLNCDLGEGLVEIDRQVMPFLQLANIACGGHAGDAGSMRETVMLALKHKVRIAAHPSYPDRDHFGRRSLEMQATELKTSLRMQVCALQEIVEIAGANLHAVKPHGALYNDMMQREPIVKLLCEVVSECLPEPVLVVQAIPDRMESLKAIADAYGVKLRFEAFADRAYLADGHLCPRDRDGSLLNDPECIANQAESIMKHQRVMSLEGAIIPVKADTLCLHGDNPAILPALQRLRERKLLNQST